MANRKMTNKFMELAVVSATSENAEFPAANAIDRTSPQKAYRSIGTSETRVVIDLGETRTDITCYLDWVNFGAFKYQESADGESGWADVTGELTVEDDPLHGVWRRRDEITLGGKRYLGILIPAQTPVDPSTGSGQAADYFRIGTFCVPVEVVEFDAETTVEYPLEAALPRTHIVENRFPTGKVERVPLSELEPMVISFDLSTTVYSNLDSPSYREAAALLRDSTKTLYLDFNLGRSWQAYLVRQTTELRARVDAPAVGTADFGAILMDVVV